jgi:hypothetical protein
MLFVDKNKQFMELLKFNQKKVVVQRLFVLCVYFFFENKRIELRLSNNLKTLKKLYPHKGSIN